MPIQSNKIVYNLIFKRSVGYIHNIVKEFSLTPSLRKRKQFMLEKYIKEHPLLDISNEHEDVLRPEWNSDEGFCEYALGLLPYIEHITFLLTHGEIFYIDNNIHPYSLLTNSERTYFVEEYNRLKDCEYNHFQDKGCLCENEVKTCPSCQEYYTRRHSPIEEHTYDSVKNIFKKNEVFYIVSHCPIKK